MSYPTGVIRVVVTGDTTPPAAAAWEAGEPAADTVDALAVAGRLAREEHAAGRYAFVWIGHNGVYAPGLWKWWLRLPPAGWIDPEIDRRERDTAAWHARKAAEAAAAKEAKAAAAAARKAALAESAPRDTSFDAIR